MASTLMRCSDERFGAVTLDGPRGTRYVYPVCTCDMGEAEIATLIPQIEARHKDSGSA